MTRHAPRCLRLLVLRNRAGEAEARRAGRDGPAGHIQAQAAFRKNQLAGADAAAVQLELQQHAQAIVQRHVA